LSGRGALPWPAPMNTSPAHSSPDAADVSALRAAITAAWALDETHHVGGLLAVAREPAPGWGEADRAAVRATATDLVQRVRARHRPGRDRGLHAPVRPGQ